MSAPMSRKPSSLDAVLGRRLASRRRRLGISQSVLAKQIGVSPQQLQKYELGANRIAASTLSQIAAILGDHPGAYFPGSPIPFGTRPFLALEPERRDSLVDPESQCSHDRDARVMGTESVQMLAE